MRQFIYIFLFLAVTAFKTDKSIFIDKAEGQKAFALLMDIRANPSKYKQQFHFKGNENVSKIKLVWNDTLAAVAETKAYDMANRDYFDHIDPDGYGINYRINKSGYTLAPDWLKNKSDNFFESIAANNTDGEAAINSLIIDAGAASFGHRKHLLGLDEWNAALTDIGIGFCRCEAGCTFQTYTCIIIARHHW